MRPDERSDGLARPPSSARAGLAAPEMPPRSEDELLARAGELAGATLGQLADALGARVPPDARRAKGWVGQLIEDGLGAAAGSRPVPDFEHLGVELKTVPVDARGRPRESTYVTTLPLLELGEVSFEASSLGRKLTCVLFVPVEAAPELPLSVRRVGNPLLWRPSSDERRQLSADWALFRRHVQEGATEAIGPELGSALQVRPKGADARDTTWTTDPHGRAVRTMRRGIYLRPGFVHEIFERSFLMPPPA